MTKTLLTTAFVLTLNACDTATQTHAPQATTDVDPVTVALADPEVDPLTTALDVIPYGAVTVSEGWEHPLGSHLPQPVYVSTWRVGWSHEDTVDLYTLTVGEDIINLVPDGSVNYVYEVTRSIPRDDWAPLTRSEVVQRVGLTATLSTNGGEPVTVVWEVL